MATIKDIAKLAGVAQGTVSNVLNGHGHVSSEKIKAVYDAARELGYVHNERAASLRKGHAKTLAVIMPDTRTRQYEFFYSSFKEYAVSQGYDVIRQFVGENSAEAEQRAVLEAGSQYVSGVACVSVTAGTDKESLVYTASFIKNVFIKNMLFVDRKPGFPCNFVGFDYAQAGKEMARKVISENFKRICLLTGDLQNINEAIFFANFKEQLEHTKCCITHIETDTFRKYQNLMPILTDPIPEAFFISNYEFAESVKDLCKTFYDTNVLPQIFTISPIFTMPENDFQKYEMNYGQLGKIAARALIHNVTTAAQPRIYMDRYLKGDGFKNWYGHISKLPCAADRLNVLMLKSPEAYIMRSFSRLFTKKTGIDVNLCICSYDEMYETFNNMDYCSYFDILRLDVTWLSWFAEKLLIPLTDVDPDIEDTFSRYIDGVPELFTKVNGIVYALPSTPSTQMLFYRKDLFEDAVQKRLFWEKHKQELTPPATFDDFNRIASFFTRSSNPDSPTSFGSTITMGSTGVAGSEYLTRLFSHQKNLYDEEGEIHLDSDISIRALYEMIEVKKYTSDTYCSWWIDTAERFAAGQYAMSLLFTNYASSLLNPESALSGKIGYSIIPGGNPLIGGGSLGVAKDSKHPDAALSFIKWMCSEPLTSAAAFLGSTSPCRKTYDNCEIVHNYPWLNLSKKCFKPSNGNRLPKELNIPFDERKFLSIIGTAARNAYSRVTSPEEALKCAQLQFEKYFPTRF